MRVSSAHLDRTYARMAEIVRERPGITMLALVRAVSESSDPELQRALWRRVYYSLLRRDSLLTDHGMSITRIGAYQTVWLTSVPEDQRLAPYREHMPRAAYRDEAAYMAEIRRVVAENPGSTPTKIGTLLIGNTRVPYRNPRATLLSTAAGRPHVLRRHGITVQRVRRGKRVVHVLGLVEDEARVGAR